MTIEEIFTFENLYNAHKKARLSKRNKKEVILFEMNLTNNLFRLQGQIYCGQYKINSYYHFKIFDPKEREIYALNYEDRVVQHCFCDNYLSHLLEPKLIYDNSACRINKGTHFALNRVKLFLKNFYKKNKNCKGYFLKCDIKKYFDNINHSVLKEQIRPLVNDERIFSFIEMIIDSYNVLYNCGLPLGNQSSQWFAIFYLNSLDRLIKEKLKIKYYSRYMDDMIIIHEDKEYLKMCLDTLKQYVQCCLYLDFNKKTQIFPIKQGVDYLGFHFYMNDNGRIIIKLRKQAKTKLKNNIKKLLFEYKYSLKNLKKINESLTSIHAHISYGNTYSLWKNELKKLENIL